MSRALDNSDSNGIIHPSRIIVNESQTWLGKETSGQIHDKRVEGIVQKTFKNIKNLAERAKEKTFTRTLSGSERLNMSLEDRIRRH